jgi:hypothetical protein
VATLASIRFQIRNVLAEGGFSPLPLPIANLEKREQSPFCEVVNPSLRQTGKLGNFGNTVEQVARQVRVHFSLQ